MDTVAAIATILTAMAAGAAAWSAMESVKAVKRSAEVTERASLIAAIPLVVPWPDHDAGRIQSFNRGAGDAHELRWRVLSDGEMVYEGEHESVVNPRTKVPLSPVNDGSVAGAVAVSRELVVECEFASSWGEDFTLRRVWHRRVPGAKLQSAGIEVLDGRGKRLQIGPE